MAEHPNGLLERARIDAGLSHGALWLRYFELGGMRTALEIRASHPATTMLVLSQYIEVGLAVQLLAAGETPKTVWRAVWETLGLPASER